MADFNLTQSDAQIQGILNAIQPFYMAGDLNALGFGYGDCTTAGNTAAKTVAIANTILTKGGCISVNFQNAFTVDNATLSVNGSTAYPIRLFGAPIGRCRVRNNTILTMRFDGSYFNVITIESQVKPTDDAVDLALPSGRLWCSHNVGAKSPEEDGLYFSWGNGIGHAEGSGYVFNQTNYDASDGGGLSGNVPANNTYDAGQHNQGSHWKLPDYADYRELQANTTDIWIEQNGVFGRRFTSDINGNSIFFPASGYYSDANRSNKGSVGYYWCLNLNTASDAKSAIVNSNELILSYNLTRTLGISVRAVM